MIHKKVATVHSFKVQRSGLKTKKALKTRNYNFKCSFCQVISNLTPNSGSDLSKMTIFCKYALQIQSGEDNVTCRKRPNLEP